MYPAGIVCWRRSCAVASAPKQPGVMAVARWGIGWHGILLSCANSVRLTKPCSLLSSQTREYTEDWCKPNMPWISCTSHCRTVAERAQCAANEKKNTCKLRKHLHQFDNTCAANTHNGTKYRNALQIQQNQIQKRTAKTEMHCKYSQHNQIQKHTANTHNATKYRNALQILTMRTNRKTLQIPTTQPNTEIHLKNRNALQILTTQPNTETCCKYAQHEQIQKHAAHTKNTTEYRNALQKLTTQQNTETRCKYSQHNQIQKCT